MPEKTDLTDLTDDNIKKFVNLYLHLNSEDPLPKDLAELPIGQWDVSRVTNMSGLFHSEQDFNESLAYWDVSNVTDMSSMFHSCHSFNQPLNSWNVSNVTDMSKMFYDCRKFNQSLNSWNVSYVTDMSSMFYECKKFNETLNSWIVSNVTDMSSMFYDCRKFNQPLNSWNVSNVTDMTSMFSKCESFNETLNSWIVSNVTDMSSMFDSCWSFNKPLNSWVVSNVIKMRLMFRECETFNEPLNSWNVSNVTDMCSMFYGCTKFNQPLHYWDVSNVTDMSEMFIKCLDFNQNLDSWDINPNDLENMFEESQPDLPAGWTESEGEEEGEEEPAVNAYQIHSEVAKINLNALCGFLTAKVMEKYSGEQSVQIDPFASYIDVSMKKIMEDGPKIEERLSDLARIMDSRLTNLVFQVFPGLFLKTVFWSLEYTKLQTKAFRSAYAETFIKDTCNAYGRIGDTSDANMSCAQGALERIILALVPARLSAIAEIESEIKAQNPSLSDEELELELKSSSKVIEFNRLDALINKSPATQIPLLIPEWYRLHRGKGFEQDKVDAGTTYPPHFEDVLVTNATERRADLRKYLIKDFPDEGPLIDKEMIKIADNIGYDDDDFGYGGRRKRRRATIRRKKIVKPPLLRRKSVTIRRKKGSPPKKRKRGLN